MTPETATTPATTTRLDTYREVARLAKALVAAEDASLKACAARGKLDPSATRARMTSANARWARAAEDRDRIRTALTRAILTADLND